jgi:hypothetical protein
MPGETGVTVVTTLVCFFIFAREAAGALDARHSLRPLMFSGQEFLRNPRTQCAARSPKHVSIYPRHCEEQSDRSNPLFPMLHGLLRLRSQ